MSFVVMSFAVMSFAEITEKDGVKLSVSSVSSC